MIKDLSQNLVVPPIKSHSRSDTTKRNTTMNLSSWLKRTISLNKTPDQSKQDQQQQQQQQQQELFFGVTDQLIEFIKTFAVETFKNCTLQEDEEEAGGESTANVRKDLSDWQERHATLVLSKVKEISQLRYQLCPRLLKEQQFWRVYFKLVKGYVNKNLSTLDLYDHYWKSCLSQVFNIGNIDSKQENEKSSDKSGYEVEMAEAKQTNGTASSGVK